MCYSYISWIIYCAVLSFWFFCWLFIKWTISAAGGWSSHRGNWIYVSKGNMEFIQHMEIHSLGQKNWSEFSQNTHAKTPQAIHQRFFFSFSCKKTKNYHLSSHASRRPMTPSVWSVWRWDLRTGWWSTNGFTGFSLNFQTKPYHIIDRLWYIYIYIMYVLYNNIDYIYIILL